jgi:multimeric flavodoxin WrbA
MGSVSWQFKKFADASSKPWYTQAWKDKIFGGFTASANVNGDKHSTLHYFMTLAMQHGGIWVRHRPELQQHQGVAAQRRELPGVQRRPHGPDAGRRERRRNERGRPGDRAACLVQRIAAAGGK